jgi:hypothetical protein
MLHHPPPTAAPFANHAPPFSYSKLPVGRGSTKARLKSDEEKARKAAALQLELDDLGINMELSNGMFPHKLRGNGGSPPILF